MTEYIAHKFSLELPIFACLNINDMTAPELAIDIEMPYSNIANIMLFYLTWGYVKATIDYSTKNNPKRYRLTPKGKRKLKQMLQLKRDHPEKWGKPKINDDIDL